MNHDSPNADRGMQNDRLPSHEAMPTPDPASLRFRRDLVVERVATAEGGTAYNIEDPRSGERYEFDERAFFICQSFDGVATASQIVEHFDGFFGRSTTEDEVLRVLSQARQLGLLEESESPSSQPDSSTPSGWRSSSAARDLEEEAASQQPSRSDRERYRWTLTDPSRFFAALERAVRPFKWLFVTLSAALVIAVPIALALFFRNQELMSQDLASLGAPASYFTRMIFTLLMINLMRCLVQGTVCTHYGGLVSKFGIRLRFGLIPRFFIDKSSIKMFDRSAKLWAYGSNLLFRLVFLVAAVLIWHLLRGTRTQLVTGAIILSHAALASLILVSLPVRAADGYRFLMTLFRLPMSTLKLAIQSLVATVRGTELPTSITDSTRRRLVLYSLVLVSFWTYAFFRISSSITAGLADSFPDVFGRSTEFLLAAIVVISVLRWALFKFSRMKVPPAVAEQAAGVTSPDERRRNWAPRVAITVGVLLVLLVPYPYRPGGQVSLLPPEGQEIQAPISGMVSDVLANGGDGQVLPQGTMIAKMVSTDLQNAILTLAEQISEQVSELQRRQAVLDELIAGARPEEIERASATVAKAAREVELAGQQLEIARVTSEFSDKELERLRELPEGLLSQVDLARAEKQASVDRLRIEEQESHLAARRESQAEAEAALALLLSGATAEDVDAARHDVDAAEADLRRLRQELAYAESQSAAAHLKMPFEGFLVDSYLQRKIGSYLNRGETYASAQALRDPIVEMILPEYDVAEIRVGSPAQIRLMAYASEHLRGEVVSVEPTSTGEMFRVTIRLLDVQEPLKAGMSGFGKIEVGYKPLVILLTRPIVRFARIEIWSWIP